MAKPVAIPLTVTIFLHLAVVAVLAFNLTFSAPPPVVVQPQIIEAKLVSMSQLPALRATPKPVTQAEPVPVDTPKPEPIKPEPVKIEPPPKPEPLKTEPPKPDLEKQKIEKQKLLESEKAKAALLAEQKKEAEQKKQEDERKRKETEEAQRKELARKQQEKNELAKAMAAEDNAMAAERDQEAMASFQGKIARDIESSWSRPPSARLGMQVTLSIQLIHTGEVINVAVLKSSGNDAFDQSAITAVRRVGKFPYLRDVSDRQFDQNFRPLVMIFNPTDLRQ